MASLSQGVLGRMERGDSRREGCCLQRWCQPRRVLGTAGVSHGWARSEADLFLLPGEAEHCIGKWLWKCILAPCWIYFWSGLPFFGVGSSWWGCASRLAPELAVGFFHLPRICTAPGCMSWLHHEEVAASAHLVLSKP